MKKKRLELSDAQQDSLKAVALVTGKSESQLLQEALERFLDSCEEERKLQDLLSVAGVWSGRKGLPSVRKLRSEWGAGVDHRLPRRNRS